MLAINRYVNAHEAEAIAALDARDALLVGAAAARRRVVDAAATDVGAASPAAAPGGLRRCALPSCGALEREYRQFSRCSGCGNTAVAYCCSSHHREDWKRHKRECRRGGDADAAKRARFEELRTDYTFCRAAYAMTMALNGKSFSTGVLAGLPDPDGPEGMAAPLPPYPADAPPGLRDAIRRSLVTSFEESQRLMQRRRRIEELAAAGRASTSRANVD